MTKPKNTEPMGENTKDREEKFNAEVNELKRSELLVCKNCGCPNPIMTYVGYWCKWCKTEL